MILGPVSQVHDSTSLSLRKKTEFESKPKWFRPASKHQGKDTLYPTTMSLKASSPRSPFKKMKPCMAASANYRRRACDSAIVAFASCSSARSGRMNHKRVAQRRLLVDARKSFRLLTDAERQPATSKLSFLDIVIGGLMIRDGVIHYLKYLRLYKIVLNATAPTHIAIFVRPSRKNPIIAPAAKTTNAPIAMSIR